MARDHGPQVKDDELYEALRREGAGKEKAARIANTGRKTAARRGGRSPAYEDWTKHELYRRAQELEVAGRSAMSKGELIDAIRDR
jgi:Rho termination factor, N-terminal domain